jgi:hypothetical protein
MKENDDDNPDAHYKEQLIKSESNMKRMKNMNNDFGIPETEEEEPIIEEDEEVNRSCCFNFFCCCCSSKIKTKDYFKKNGKNIYLKKEMMLLIYLLINLQIYLRMQTTKQ